MYAGKPQDNLVVILTAFHMSTVKALGSAQGVESRVERIGRKTAMCNLLPRRFRVKGQTLRSADLQQRQDIPSRRS